MTVYRCSVDSKTNCLIWTFSQQSRDVQRFGLNRFLDSVGVVQWVTMVSTIQMVLQITSLTMSFCATLTIPDPRALDGTRLECGGDVLEIIAPSEG